MSDLAAFLLARIEEREDAARRAMGNPDEYVPEGWDLGVVRSMALAGSPSNVLVHVSYAEPARVLAECAAKRRIVGQLTMWQEWTDGPDKRAALNMLSPVALYLASPYADHPDFREEWQA